MAKTREFTRTMELTNEYATQILLYNRKLRDSFNGNLSESAFKSAIKGIPSAVLKIASNFSAYATVASLVFDTISVVSSADKRTFSGSAANGMEAMMDLMQFFEDTNYKRAKIKISMLEFTDEGWSMPSSWKYELISADGNN